MRYKKFAGREVVDAEVALHVPMIQTDIDKAEEMRSYGVNDPGRFSDCVLAQTCQRVLGVNNAQVRINHTTAYVAWEGSDKALRFVPPRWLVEAFDAEEDITPGLITLEPPPPKRTLKAMRDYYHSQEARKREGQDGPRTERRQSPAKAIDVTVRNGIFARKNRSS